MRVRSRAARRSVGLVLSVGLAPNGGLVPSVDRAPTAGPVPKVARDPSASLVPTRDPGSLAPIVLRVPPRTPRADRLSRVPKATARQTSGAGSGDAAGAVVGGAAAGAAASRLRR
jgi:hypothetical protein